VYKHIHKQSHTHSNTHSHTHLVCSCTFSMPPSLNLSRLTKVSKDTKYLNYIFFILWCPEAVTTNVSLLGCYITLSCSRGSSPSITVSVSQYTEKSCRSTNLYLMLELVGPTNIGTYNAQVSLHYTPHLKEVSIFYINSLLCRLATTCQ